MTSSWVRLLLGQQVGPYALQSHIASGGFGIIFEGAHVDTGAVVAVKVLDPGQAQQPRHSAEFDNEGHLLGKLNSCSNVINLVHTGEQVLQVSFGNGMAAPLTLKYHVLSRASGALSELVSDAELLATIEWGERLAHWRGAVKGVHQMHLKNVVHRDIKAENILLMAGPRNSVEARVADLGKSKDLTTPSTLAPIDYVQGCGDLRHAPPEYLWLQGGNDPVDFLCADLYSLGSTLAELATGQPMTSLAIGPWRPVVDAAKADFRAGLRQDLGVLRPKFSQAINDIASEVPPVIRENIRGLLSQLCSPVPVERLPRHGAKGRSGISWLLRSADIMIYRLSVADRQKSYNIPHLGRGAS